MAKTAQHSPTARRTVPERARTAQERRREDPGPEAARQALAFRALLEGASPARLPAELAALAAQRAGNQAALSLLSRSRGGWERPAPVFPEDAPDTAPARWSGGAPAADEAGAPAFSALSER